MRITQNKIILIEKPVTFEEVEKMWTEQVAPTLKTFETMKNTSESPPEDSQWFAQWKIPELP